MASKKRKRGPRILAAVPWACVVLAIDPGASSGAAIFVRGALVESFQVRDDAIAREDVVARALRYAEGSCLPLMVVREKHTAGGWRSASSIAGTGAAWGKWAQALEAAGVPKRRIIGVTPQTWRSRTIGGPQRKSDAWKRDARVWVGARWNLEVPENESDRAEAICIGSWGSRSQEVGERIPKRRGRAAA